ncbi:hypothetical protein [Deinococcus sedimenti]|uniref:Uncharacterized protein n=1 Tax=Deinococcus sedimenti TaxID=1867090 RepID=A0ABQ2S7X9_9DEIO|nr:hypothetical protein [Deinococcus sedimenti]GGR95892.1 hypothetical protein GCM10008960_23480 [Deinococcus sedimenti]
MTVDCSVTLAAAAGWSVLAEFETVTVQRPDGARWDIGWMYGNPEAALITWENTYAVVVGCGVIVADLRRFGEPVTPGLDGPDPHLRADPPEPWWFENVYQQDVGRVRLVADVYSEQAGVYDLDLSTRQFTRLIPHSPET